MKSQFSKICITVVICVAIGLLSSIATQSSISTWYPTLNKPSFNPPNWIFAPVWTVLYIMMGIAAGLVWHQKYLYPSAVKKALWVFGIQLFLNALWSILFFGKNDPLLALVDIIFLLLFILLTISYFYKIRPIAGYLLIPYLLWVSFATALNASIWWLNP
ncbi:TspO/MBR family protein [Flavobacterium kingsejongi]|uniref:Sensory protein TspO n=1 Tax=Flavobacterium kingsejongi TaxID=1678728 RepID=A0A2S1LMW7_9FLAO|nr:TspO/MBR family protein [Flavobacterium kingsejongi]AWG25085.1 sensory protein TspO [Flavobacterium kingsejongi]